MKKNILINEYLPLVILFILYFYAHSLIGISGDDVGFRNADHLDTIPEVYSFLRSFYASWLPSVVPTAVYIFFVRHDIWMWRLADTMICTALVYQIVNLFFGKETRQRAMWVMLLLFMTYEFTDMSTAGWMATTLRYTWCLCGLLLSMNSVKAAIAGSKLSKISIAGILLTTVYAVQVEQGAAILMPTYLLLLAYLYKTKRDVRIVAVQSIITLISLFFLLTSPAIKLRYLAEIKTWYPEYANFSPMFKLYLGITSTIANRIFDHVNWIYIFFVIGILVAIKCRNVLKAHAFLTLSAIYFVPIFCQLKLWPRLWGNFAVSNTYNFALLGENRPFIIMTCTIVIIAICIGIYNAFDRRWEKILYILIFMAGFLSRVLMGFSPTIYASSTRTFVFFDFAMIIVAGKILVNYLYTKNISFEDVKWGAIGAIGMLSYFQLIRNLRELRHLYR